jgi:hypothetical protein
MKKFSFPLDRVLAWRHTQARIEEAVLEKLRSELRLLDQQRNQLDQSVVDARDHLLRSRSASGPEIAALEHYRAASAREAVHLGHTRASLVQRIAQQTAVVADRRRDARLLEKLRERRFAQWRQSADREVEELAEESFLSKFARSTNG